MRALDTRAGSRSTSGPDDGFDHGSDPSFLTYYERESRSEKSLARFRTLRDKSLTLLKARGRARERLEVVDVGCGAGAQSILWAELGHAVYGLDVNAPLI